MISQAFDRITDALDRIRSRSEVVDALWVAWLEYERDHARYLATAMIYYAIVSVIPLLLLLLAALGLVLRFSAVRITRCRGARVPTPASARGGRAE